MVVGMAVSDPSPVYCGIQLGSVLGPILFCIVGSNVLQLGQLYQTQVLFIVVSHTALCWDLYYFEL